MDSPSPEILEALEREVDDVFRMERDCEAQRSAQKHPATWYMIRDCGCPVASYCTSHRIVAIYQQQLAGAMRCQTCNATTHLTWGIIHDPA